MAQGPDTHPHSDDFVFVLFCFPNRQTGLLLLGMKENPELKTMQATLSRQGVEHQRLSSEELKQRFPNIRLARGEVGLLDKSGGVLYADHALRALQVILCSTGGNMPGLGILGSNQPSPEPLLDEILCHAGLGLTFGQGTFIYPARPCQYGRRGLGSALNERLFLYRGELHT